MVLISVLRAGESEKRSRLSPRRWHSQKPTAQPRYKSLTAEPRSQRKPRPRGAGRRSLQSLASSLVAIISFLDSQCQASGLKGSVCKCAERAVYSNKMRPEPLSAEQKAICILSWNVNSLNALLKKAGFSPSGNSYHRKSGVLHKCVLYAQDANAVRQLATSHGADVVCMQETKLQDKGVEDVKAKLVSTLSNLTNILRELSLLALVLLKMRKS